MFEAEEETRARATDRKAHEVFWKNRRNGRGWGCGQKSYLGLTEVLYELYLGTAWMFLSRGMTS